VVSEPVELQSPFPFQFDNAKLHDFSFSKNIQRFFLFIEPKNNYFCREFLQAFTGTHSSATTGTYSSATTGTYSSATIGTISPLSSHIYLFLIYY